MEAIEVVFCPFPHISKDIIKTSFGGWVHVHRLKPSSYERLVVEQYFQLCVQSNPELHWFYFTAFCDWFRKLVPPSQPIRCKTKTNRDLVTRVFPRLRQFTCIYFEFSLAPCDIYLCSDWPLWLLVLWFLFYDTQSKSALKLLLVQKPRSKVKPRRKFVYRSIHSGTLCCAHFWGKAYNVF